MPAGIEPINSLQIFESSKALGGKRYSIDNKGEVHQFTNSRDSWHWAGGSADTKAKLVLDNITKSKLRDLFPKHKDNPRLQ